VAVADDVRPARRQFPELGAIEAIGLTIPDPDLKWNEQRGAYDFGAIDWDEFYAVVRGEGPVAKERMEARINAWEEGAWVREAASAHAAKRARKAEAA
jgi:ring-1,2-phenylacetyl-CoA epoxidase subunit PaaA